MNDQQMELFLKAEKILASRMQSSASLKKKLEKYSSSGEDKELVCDELQRLGLLDDRRFVEEYLRSMMTLRPKGFFVVSQELQMKYGIGKDLTEEIWETMEIDEQELAQLAFERKAHVLTQYPEKGREKMTRFLQSRGFSFGVIQKCFSRAVD